MQSPADDRGGGFDEHRQAAPAVPSDGDKATSSSGKSKVDHSPKPNGSSPSSERRGKLDEYLFSEDARMQYAALKELVDSTAITKTQYDRIHAIRWATRHLALAELADRLLKERRFSGPLSTDAHKEILALIRLCERQQRERLFKEMQEDPIIAFPRASLARWLVSAVLAGFVLGGGLAYLFAHKGGSPGSTPAEAYIDTRTGQVVSVDSESEKHRAGAGKEGDYQPAFYCWQCRQWLPVKNPRKPDTAANGPVQSLSDRPIAPQMNRK